MRVLRGKRTSGGALLATVLALVLCPEISSAGDGIVALQTADPSCPDDSDSIYVDCGNGTVTDNRTGLVWLKNADCLNTIVDWFTARDVTAGLSDKPAGSPAANQDCGLSDGSSSGEWRLPSIEEWEAMVADADALGCDPTITDNAGNGCWQEPADCFFEGSVCAFTNVRSSSYWSSSSTIPTPPLNAWLVNMASGSIHTTGKTFDALVWPVRGGQ